MNYLTSQSISRESSETMSPEFTYLAAKVCQDRSVRRDIDGRIANASMDFGQMSKLWRAGSLI